VTTLTLAVPATATETGPGGGSSDTSTGQGAIERRTTSVHDAAAVVALDGTRRTTSVHDTAAVVALDGTRRTTSVHDTTTGVWLETPPTTDAGTSTSEALPIAAGALGGLALVGVGLAAFVLVRRHHEHGGMAHPA